MNKENLRQKIIDERLYYYNGDDTLAVEHSVCCTMDTVVEELDKAILKIKNHLPYVSSPEEYWMDQGSINALRELKEQLLDSDQS